MAGGSWFGRHRQQESNKQRHYYSVIKTAAFWTIIRSSFAAETLHITTTTLLTLLLPVAFLLIARFSCYNYLIVMAHQDTSPPSFINTAVIITLHGLVSLVTLSALVNSITSKAEPAGFLVRTKGYNRLESCVAWMLICCLQMTVRIGAELDGSRSAVIAAVMSEMKDDDHDDIVGLVNKVGDNSFDLLIRAVLLLGLYEIMFHWLSVVVRPVVDGAVFGRARDEWWVQRVAIGLSFGTLWWWWGLNEEVESLTIVATAKWNQTGQTDNGGTQLIGMDLLGWWLYYVTFIIGMVRVAKGVMWVAFILLCERRVVSESVGDDELGGVEDKV